MSTFKCVVAVQAVLFSAPFTAVAQDSNHAKEPSAQVAQSSPETSERSASPRPALQVAVIHLKYAVASDLAPLLLNACRSLDPEAWPTIVADSRTNSIVVTTTASGIEKVKYLVGELDQESPARPGSEPADQSRRVRVTARIYKVQLKDEAVDAVSSRELSEAAKTTSSLKAALEALGEDHFLLQADQIMTDNAEAQETKMGIQSPRVMGTTALKAGGKANNIEYNSVGILIEGSGKALSASRGHADVQIEFDDVDESDVVLQDNIRAPVIRNWNQHFNGTFRSGVPIVLTTVDARSESAPTLYVTWFRFDIEAAP